MTAFKSNESAYKGVQLHILDEGIRQRKDEHLFGTESYPRRSRFVQSTSEFFIALERYSRISANGHSSFPKGPCSDVLARRGLHYCPQHQQWGGSDSFGSRQTLHSANWQQEVLSWLTARIGMLCINYHTYVHALPDYE